MNSNDLNAVLNHFPEYSPGGVEVLPDWKALTPAERDIVPEWWSKLPGEDPRRNASTTAAVWSDQLGSTLVAEVIDERAEVHLVRFSPSPPKKSPSIALLYTFAPRPDAVDRRTVAMLGHPPTPTAFDQKNWFPASASGLYRQVHDGIDVDIAVGETGVIGSSDVLTWSDRSDQGDEELEFLADPPYVPHADELRVIWTETSSGMTVMLDRENKGAVWKAANYVLDFVDDHGEGLLHEVERHLVRNL